MKGFSEKIRVGFNQQGGGRDALAHRRATEMTRFKSLDEGDGVGFDVKEGS